MAQVTIYTKPYCPYCVRAVSLLEKKGVEFTEIEAAFDPGKRQEMVQRAKGCDDMMALEYAGKLDTLLAA
jgi:glutaredoxin 3